jgi:transcriptional regulator with XRE-family HTH domain
MSQLSKSIGNKIKKIRIQKNLTQEDLAEKLYMTPAGYGKIERGDTDLTIKKLEQICDVLEISVFDMITFDETNIFNVTHSVHGVWGHINTYNTQKDEATQQLIQTLTADKNELRQQIKEQSEMIKQLLDIVTKKGL